MISYFPLIISISFTVHHTAEPSETQYCTHWLASDGDIGSRVETTEHRHRVRL